MWTVLFVLAAAAAAQGPAGWKPLFNGKNLDGWETYLGAPRKGEPPRGLNHDPDGVFSVVEADGAPAIRISGQTMGAVTTKDEFEDFHFRVEFKWGTLTWGPRKGLPKDSGILYYCVGRHGAGGGAWMKSVESNVMEDDNGSFWPVAGAIADIELGEEKLAYSEDPKHPFPMYQKGGALKPCGPSGADGIRPNPIVNPRGGGWCTAEVLAMGGDSLHVFDGQVTMVLRNARHKVGEKLSPLTKGKIQLQSELAEVFFRKPEIRPLREFPTELRAWLTPAGGDDSAFEPMASKDWEPVGDGTFEWNNGTVTAKGDRVGLLRYKAKRFKNFSLRGEYLQAPGGRSGLSVRRDPQTGHMIAIGENEVSETKTMSISWASISGGTAPTTLLPLKPEGEWNAFEIVCSGRTIEAWLNGKLVTRHIGSDAAQPLSGTVALATFPSAPVHFRKLRMREFVP